MSSEERPHYCRFYPDHQVIRRQDLVELGDTFKTALSPVSSLVEVNKEQNIGMSQMLSQMSRHTELMSRFQFMLVAVTVVSAVALLLHVGAVWSIRYILVRIEETAQKLEAVAETASSAKMSAEEAKTEAAALSSAAASKPEIRVVPGEGKKGGKGGSLKVLIIPPKGSASEAEEEEELEIPVEDD